MDFGLPPAHLAAQPNANAPDGAPSSASDLGTLRVRLLQAILTSPQNPENMKTYVRLQACAAPCRASALFHICSMPSSCAMSFLSMPSVPTLLDFLVRLLWSPDVPFHKSHEVRPPGGGWVGWWVPACG